MLNELEDHLRSTKGLPERKKVEHGGSHHGGSHHGGSHHGGTHGLGLARDESSRTLPRRPSFQDTLDLEAMRLEAAGAGAAPAAAAPTAHAPSGAVGGESAQRRCRMFIELEQCVQGVWSEYSRANVDEFPICG